MAVGRKRENMLKRKLQILRLMMCGNGYRRAEYLKKINHLYKRA